MKVQKLIVTITVIVLIAILGTTAYILIEPDFSKPKAAQNSNVTFQTVSSGNMENSINTTMKVTLIDRHLMRLTEISANAPTHYFCKDGEITFIVVLTKMEPLQQVLHL